MKRVTIPNTRLEGHGKVDILIDDDDNVQDTYFQVVEFRGFEKFCEGRHVEELPRITPKICGVCPGAHHMASSKATDAVYGVEIPSAAKKLRELFYNAHMAHSHILHFYTLAAPDLILPDADAAKRNIFGLIEELGKDVGKEIIQARNHAQKIQEMIAGHPTYPVASIPGGMSKPLEEDDRQKIEEMAKKLVEFGKNGFELFHQYVAKNEDIKDLIDKDFFTQKTHYAGMVDDNGHVNFYDGKMRVITPEGKEQALFDAQDYSDHIAEHSEEWSYIKFPYLKNVGWKGIVDGPDSGVYRVNSLARLNVANGMATPVAQQAYENFYDFFGEKPVHNLLAYHLARLVEIMYAAERTYELALDKEITSRDVRTNTGKAKGEGVGVVEAPRGTLYHHYTTDKKGITQKVNLIVATVQNNAAINLSIKNAAQNLINNGEPDEKLQNKVEMAVRAYDPCLACASHKLPINVKLHKI